MRVPEEAAEGKAKLTLTFPDLKTLKVASSTVEIVVKKASAGAKAPERTHGDVPAVTPDAPAPAPAPVK